LLERLVHPFSVFSWKLEDSDPEEAESGHSKCWQPSNLSKKKIPELILQTLKDDITHLGLVPPVFHAGGELGSDQFEVLKSLTLSLMARKGATNQLSLNSAHTK